MEETELKRFRCKVTGVKGKTVTLQNLDDWTIRHYDVPDKGVLETIRAACLSGDKVEVALEDGEVVYAGIY
jgi:hypothetical protein